MFFRCYNNFNRSRNLSCFTKNLKTSDIEKPLGRVPAVFAVTVGVAVLPTESRCRRNLQNGTREYCEL